MLKERFLFILKFFHIVVNTTSFHITSQTTIQPTWAIHHESQRQNERGLQPQARLCVLMKPWSLSKENLVSVPLQKINQQNGASSSMSSAEEDLNTSTLSQCIVKKVTLLSILLCTCLIHCWMKVMNFISTITIVAQTYGPT